MGRRIGIAARRWMLLSAALVVGSLGLAASAHGDGFIEGTVKGLDQESEDFGFKACVNVYDLQSTPTSPPVGSALIDFPSGSYSASSQGNPLGDGTYRVMFDECPLGDGTFLRDDPEEQSERGTAGGYMRTWYDGSSGGAPSFQKAANVEIAGSDAKGVDVRFQLYGQGGGGTDDEACKKAKKKHKKAKKAVKKAEKKLKKAKKKGGNVAKAKKKLKKAKKKAKEKKKAKNQAC